MRNEVKTCMVADSKQGKMYNLQPLFDLFQTADVEKWIRVMDEHIRLFITSVDPEVFDQYVKDDISYMYCLRDMFTQISECQISIPKGGAV